MSDVPELVGDPSEECRAAIGLGDEALRSSHVPLANYTLVQARNLAGESGTGPRTWRLTYKSKRLLPEASDEELGAGGEIFLQVDLDRGEAAISGYGE